MKPRLLVAVSVVLIALLAWLILHRDDASSALVAGPERSPPAKEMSDPRLDVVAGNALTESAPIPSPTSVLPASPPRREAIRPQSIVLYGYVRTGEGMPPRTDAPYVSVTDSSGGRINATASAEGAYSISGLLPGPYLLKAGVGVESNAKVALDLSLEDSPKRYDIILSVRPSLLVKVVGRDGKPLTNPWLGAAATREPPGDWVDESPNSNPFGVGRFDHNGLGGSTVAAEYLGRLNLDVQPPVFVSLLHNQRVLATQQAEAGQKEVEFIVDGDSPLLKTGQVRVHFVDHDGHDVPGMWAMVEGGASMRQMQLEGGVLIAGGLAPGWYRIRPFAKGLEQRELPFRALPGEDKDFGDVTLESEQWIAGTITEPSKSNAKLSLRCDPYDPDEASTLRSGNITQYATQPDGTFRIPSRGRGLYLVKLTTSRETSYGIWARIVDTRAGPVENLRVVLVPGVALIVRPSSEDWYSVTYTIKDDAGTPYVSSRLWGTDPSKILLAPGHYQIEARRGSSEPTRKSITIANETVEVALP